MSAKRRYLVNAVSVLTALLFFSGCQKEYSATAPKYQAPLGANEFTPTIPGDLSGRKIEQGGKCSLDSVNKIRAATATKVVLNTDLYLSGWAVDEQRVSPGKAIVVELRSADGKTIYYAATTTRGQRPDVATALKNRKYENSGFELSAVSKAVTAGSYTINILIINKDGIISCDTSKKFVFK